MTEPVTLKLWMCTSTLKACMFSTTPESEARGKVVWLPSSMIEIVSQKQAENIGRWQECEVKMPRWLAVEKGLA